MLINIVIIERFEDDDTGYLSLAIYFTTGDGEARLLVIEKYITTQGGTHKRKKMNCSKGNRKGYTTCSHASIVA